jgi:4-amino-4-deoxy-L-arabinose transferase-like glycosyltransferase
MIVAVAGIAMRPALPIDETRYLAVAWEMHLSGDWLVPTKNFALYSDKPPLLFWLINLVWLVTGVSEFAARIVVPALACVALWLTARLAGLLWPDDADAGRRAAMALAGLAVFAVFGNLTMFDVPLTVTVLLGLVFLQVAALSDQSRRMSFLPWCGFGLSVGLGVLTKGPVILFHLLPVAVTVPWWGRSMPWRALPARLGVGLLVAVFVVSLWLVPAAIAGGAAYRDAILWHQSAGRLAESFAHARPWWFYVAVLPALCFPLGWSPSLRRAGRTVDWLSDRGLRLCLVWTLGAFLLFSVTSGKQIHYLVPELPAVALIVARLTRGEGRVSLVVPAVLLLIAALAAIPVAAGLLPLAGLETLLEPGGMVLVPAALVAALCWLSLRTAGLAAAAMLSLGTLTAINLTFGATRLGRAYDAGAIAAILAAEQQHGIAVLGTNYHAEFNFAARLTAPVDTLPAAGVPAWIEGHPDGVIIGRADRAALPWPPRETIDFRNRPYGIWHVAERPRSDDG